ncbi:TBC1 domain family member 16-like isoform X2 [Ornithodoros turicata]|uniref:TBC1 domain family member 16-like isoform X2 n=1 Tax=Ornithodoros turicata TaxID=34597 RepID=UPI003138C499
MHTWIRRASDLFQWGSGKSRSTQKSSGASDGELIYCKNNICVHPPVSDKAGVSHHPGYLTIKAQNDPVVGCTLWLTWIPNTSLKKHPHSLENRSTCSSPCRSTCPSTCPSICPSPTSLKRMVPSLEFRDSDRQDESCHRWPEGQSISSLASEVGSPREEGGSLDSWTASDRAEMTASTVESPGLSLDPSDAESGTLTCEPACPEQAGPPEPPPQSQTDSGIGPEEVSAALESMISCLDRIGTDANVCTGGTIHEHPDSAVGSLSEKDSSATERAAALCEPESQSAELEQEVIGSTTDVLKENGEHETDSVDIEVCSGLDTSDSREIPTVMLSRHSRSRHSGGNSSSTSTCSSSSSFSSSERGAAKSRKDTTESLRTRLLLQEGTPESLAVAHNLAFPEQVQPSSSPDSSRSPTACRRITLLRESPCGVFSVDLSHMRSLRLLFSNKECTCGQLVIASRESQYKIFHFHHGGLDRLAQVLGSLDFLLKGKHTNRNESCPYAHFSVWKPQVPDEECHPEEGIFTQVDESVWRGHMTSEGVIEDELQLRKAIFFKGLDPRLRKEVWPFLLQHYSFASTLEEREQIRNDKYIEYQNIRLLRENMNEKERECFWRNVECIVEKDVIRTDRTNPFYAGDDNPNIETMKNILLNYAAYQPWMGYTQGMSDLLAPVLTELQDETQAFWCFVGLMQHTIFVSSPRDGDMDTNLARGLLHQFRLLPRVPCTLAGLCELCGSGMWDSRPVPLIDCRGHYGEQRSCPWGGQDPPPGTVKHL